MDSGFVNLKLIRAFTDFDRQVPFHHAQCLKYGNYQIIPTNPSDNVNMLPNRRAAFEDRCTIGRRSTFSGGGSAAVTGRGGVCAGGNVWSAPQRVRRSAGVP